MLLDLSKLEFIDCAGMHVLVRAVNDARTTECGSTLKAIWLRRSSVWLNSRIQIASCKPDGYRVC